MKNIIVLIGLSLVLCGLASGRTFAAPTDIVPRGSTLLDAFAALARADAFGAADTPEDFLGEPLYTRGQLARLLEHLIQEDPDKVARLQKDAGVNAALQAALQALQPEVKSDGLDLSEVETTPSTGTSVGGYVQPELRLRTGGDPQPGNGVLGLYRLTALGNLRSNLRYALSASNWPQDYRRVFNNDIGPHDFSAVNEAFLELDAGRGLTVDLGRMYNHWGPGYRGATMVSDNAPAFDQLQVSFPFSLGPRLGREYHFSQFISTFTESGTRKYFEGRRVEYNFSPHLTADFQEAFKSSSSHSLIVTLIPNFNDAQSSKSILHDRGLDQYFNSFVNAGLSYAATPDIRFYGQFGIDDIQSPGRQSYRTPRKIAYLIGTAFQPAPGTGVVAEYTFADPTTYTSRDVKTQWQMGMNEQIGLPAGPNSHEIFLRLSQRLSPGLSLALQSRDRRRHNDAFPEPHARDLAATVQFSPNKQNGFEVTYHDYRQDAFPLPSSVIVPGDGFTPANAEGFYGQNLRIRQLDLAYKFFF